MNAKELARFLHEEAMRFQARNNHGTVQWEKIRDYERRRYLAIARATLKLLFGKEKVTK